MKNTQNETQEEWKKRYEKFKIEKCKEQEEANRKAKVLEQKLINFSDKIFNNIEYEEKNTKKS